MNILLTICFVISILWVLFAIVWLIWIDLIGIRYWLTHWDVPYLLKRYYGEINKWCRDRVVKNVLPDSPDQTQSDVQD